MDRCWSVPLSAALSAFLLVMNSSCYGFLYVLFMKKYEVNHASAAWPSSALVIAGSSLAVSVVQDRLSLYHITLLGGFLASLGLVASAFAPNIAWMTFTFGVLHGAGIGTALLALSMYILVYFKRYSGTAFAIMWLSRAVSGMAGTQLLWYLANAYGVEGCLLITGGLLLHVVPFTMFIKSPSPIGLRLCAFTLRRREKTYTPVPHTLKKGGQLALPHSDELPEKLPPTQRPLATASSFASIMSSLRCWPFYAVLCYSAMTDYIFVTFSSTVVAYGVDKGCALKDSKQLVTYNSMGLLVGRLVIPFATDKLSSRRCPAAVACFLVAAICFAVLTQISAYAALATTASVMGVAQGYLLCIRSVIVADHVGLECFTFCCGVGGLLSVPLWLSGPSIIGFFRDKNGSYDYFYFMLAALCLFHAVLLASLAWREVVRGRQRMHEEPTSELQHMKEPCTV
ncbi:hypothetical protein HPB50_024185 [Hyalomma asiaticum]|uniref:Uncharacterized protein n=1 Tax=Hyalomma asiaticum TaxID=266040 RepID=A0ACB7SIH3_HYAAI|nr:hypothetical protein HPB50_024185 [Hyalomma asiaticum]